MTCNHPSEVFPGTRPLGHDADFSLSLSCAAVAVSHLPTFMLPPPPPPPPPEGTCSAALLVGAEGLLLLLVDGVPSPAPAAAGDALTALLNT